MKIFDDNGVELLSIVQNSFTEHKSIVLYMVVFYLGMLVPEIIRKGKYFYKDTFLFRFFKRRKNKLRLNSLVSRKAKRFSAQEIKKLNLEISKLKNLDSVAELNIKKDIGSKDEVYERVKYLYKFLLSEDKKKSFGLTEAVLMLQNMKTYSFFTKEDATIGFERNIVVVDEVSQVVKTNQVKVERAVENYSASELLELINNFKIPEALEKEMLIAVLSGNTYTYPVIPGLSFYVTNEKRNFVKRGETISLDASYKTFAYPYSDRYKLTTTKDAEGKEIHHVSEIKDYQNKKKSKEKKEDKEPEKSKEEKNNKSDSVEPDFPTDTSIEIDVLEIDEKNKVEKVLQNQSNEPEIEKNLPEIISENIFEIKSELNFSSEQKSIIGFFSKNSYASVDENFEIEIFKKLFSNLKPQTPFAFLDGVPQQNNFFIYIEPELFVNLVSNAICAKAEFEKIYYKARGNNNFFNLAALIETSQIAAIRKTIEDNFTQVALSSFVIDNEKKVSTNVIKNILQIGEEYFLFSTLKFKVSKEIFDALIEIGVLVIKKPEVLFFREESKTAKDLKEKQVVFKGPKNVENFLIAAGK